MNHSYLDNHTVAGPFRIALVQMNPQIGRVVENRNYIAGRIFEAEENGADLVVFPECAISGYVYGSKHEAMEIAETVPGESADSLDFRGQSSIYSVVGMLERDGDTLYNSAVVTGPNGLIATYRKSHLPVLGVDRFAEHGAELAVIDLPFARIGLLICYDLRFPEAARTLALRGADVIVVPTNWPEGAESSPDFLTRARAWENRVYVAACNRVGTENGTRFIGRSHILDVDGALLAEADGSSEAIIYADIDPRRARDKRIVIKAGEFEFDPIGGRRPELYGDLTR